MKTALVVASIALVVGGGFFIWWQGNESQEADTITVAVEPEPDSPTVESREETPVSPFSSVSSADETSVEAPQVTTPNDPVVAKVDNTPATDVKISEEALAWQAFDLGVADISDEQIAQLTLRLKNDPAFLQAVVSEFGVETDPKRLKRLSYLLGATKDSSLTPIASDMVYSGNRVSQLAGLDLLKRMQPYDASARDVVMNLLTTDSEPEVLVATLNVLVLPGEATNADKQAIVDHVLPLTNNDSASVRQRSISIISQWSDDDTMSDVLLSGLNDVDEQVRKTAAYASKKLSSPSADVIEALFGVLENQNELPRARKGARLSLQSQQLSESNKVRLETADTQMRNQYK